MTATKKPIEKTDMEEIERILELTRAALSEEQHRKLTLVIETLAFLTSEIAEKNSTIRHLRNLLFGSGSEKTKLVLPEEPEGGDAKPAGEEGAPEDKGGAGGDDDAEKKKRKKRKGHGRNGAEKYVGAEQVEVPHESLKPGDDCPDPECKGRVYRLRDPAVIVRLVGRAPVSGTVHKLERYRCNLCLRVYKAKAPEGMGEKKYDESSAAMIALLKYGSGLPFNRLERLEGNLGIPLPAATQWDIVSDVARRIEPAYQELIRQAAQGEVLHNDDTTVKILELMKEDRERRERGDPPDRTGMFTSGIVSVRGEIRIALFFTGREHAGENLARVLAERAAELAPPIQMCDALSRNVSEDFEAIVCNCMSHARRSYVDIVESFPEECRFVLETLREVFRNDAKARTCAMTPEERLELHRKESFRPMAELRLWMSRKLRDREVEPNSGLGKAMAYMRNHWRKLTRFLFVAGAPLENNLCERVLKRAICHRKNSLFYKTENGARVGDLFMTLIATCELVGTNPFDYLTELQRHREQVTENPGAWLPWNYHEALERDGLSSGLRARVG
jgi:hypothetical protein